MLIDQEALETAQEEGPELALRRIRRAQEIPLDESREERLREVRGIFGAATFTAYEGIERVPVRLQ